MITFDTAFERLIGHEGGYSNDPKDPGNWTGGECGVGELKGTKYGIAANTFPWIDIKNLTLEQAKALYLKHYWDLLKQADSSLKYQFFDAAVNHGPGNATRILQRAVEVADDGKWGPVSQAALDKLEKNDALMRFISKRIKFWTSLKKFDTYGRGWSNRAADVLWQASLDN